eukprot:3608139-Heterocapsa_arctica.AAC.1
MNAVAVKAMRLWSGLSGFVGPDDVDGGVASIARLRSQSSSSFTADNLRSGQIPDTKCTQQDLELN